MSSVEVMMDEKVTPVPDSQNNNNHNNHNHLENSKEDNEAGPVCEPDTDGDGEVMRVMKDVSETEQTNDSSNYSPPPPRKIARRSKGSGTRKSTSSPRLKVPTPTSITGTPCGSSSEREPNSSPASIDNPATNGSANVRFCI